MRAAVRDLPSMEGRTIVRPNLDHVVPLAAGGTHLQWRAGRSSGQIQIIAELEAIPGVEAPSMEGRTIVRPNKRSRR